jgi:peptidoglycan hydrolase CwlO-like protein
MMNDMLMNIGVVVFIVFAIVSIAYQLNAYRAASALREFLCQSSGDMKKVLTELSVSLENLRKITDNISVVTEDVREITSTVTDLQRDVRTLYSVIKETVGSTVKADIAGLKAGVKTGIVTLVKNLKEDRSDQDERRT